MTVYSFKVLPGVTAPAGAPANPLINLRNAWEGAAPLAFQAILDALGGAYDVYQRARLAQTWIDLYDAGLLAKLDSIHMLGLTEADSLINWAGGAAAVSTGAAWDGVAGHTTDGVDDFVTFGNPSAMPDFLQNSACFGIFCADETGVVSNTYQVGMNISGAPDNTLYSIQTGTDTVAWAVQTSPTTNASYEGAQTGMWLANRTGATAAQIYKDGVQIGTTSQASTVLRNGSLSLGRQSTSFTVANAAAFVAGAGLTAQEAADLSAIISGHVAKVQGWAV
ncbi:hypothetical protein [Pseudooceanicola algae]|uniref:Uncharacterized protein n=1 Tax=Pseudooceanicola algae TaxID=1537215 RepID=A0A418SK93_9RHOB|nr:hypothetical protein [Pseudooceanicola algae]QPM89163.1 hypothetical protein PSAL_003740 [Pseudooceanicola algae]